MLQSGLCSISFRNLDIEQIVDLCDKANIRNIEWGSDVHVPSGDFTNAKKVKELCNKRNIDCPSYGTYFKCENEDGFVDLCKTAKILGAKTLRVWAGTKSSKDVNEKEYANFISLVSRLANIAKGYDLDIGFENHKITLTDNIDSILKLHKDLPFDNVKFYFQPDYWNEYKSDEYRINANLHTLSNVEPFLANVHVYQWYIRTLQREPLSDGHYEWLEYLKLINKDSVCYLEFIKDDSALQFLNDAKELNSLIKEVNGYQKPIRYPYKENEVYELLLKNQQEIDLLNEEVKNRWINSLILKDLNKTLFECADIELNKESPINKKEEWELFYKTGERFAFEVPYNTRRNRLKLFAYSYYLSKKEVYLNAAIKEIDNILNEYSWTIPAHFEVAFLKIDDNKKHQRGIDLTSAVTGASLAEIVYMLKDVLPTELINRVKETAKEYLFDNIDKPYWWAINVPTNNWAAVCGGNVGVAAMYLVDDLKELARILTFSLNTCSHYIDGFQNDGACVEGGSYWNYGFGMYLAFADLLLRKSGGAINLFDNEKVHNISRFINAITITKNKSVCFSDSMDSNVYLYGFICRLHEIYPDIEPRIDLFDNELSKDSILFTTEHEEIALREFIWAKDACPMCKNKGATYIFKDTGWFIASSDNQITTVAFKAGHNFEPHNHLDVGSFELFVNGEPVITDLGKGVYTKDYFDNDVRYKNIFCCSAKSHSVPVIDDHEQEFGIENRSQEFSSTDNSVSIEFSKAYGLNTKLISAYRSMKLNKASGDIELNDKFFFITSKHEIIERFVLNNEPSISGKKIILNDKFIFEAETMFDSYTINKVVDIDANNNERISYVLELKYNVTDNQINLKFKGKNA